MIVNNAEGIACDRVRKPPVPLLDVSYHGRPREMGRILGQGSAAKIRLAEASLRRLRAFRLQQPWWMPYSMYRYVAEWRAHSSLAASIGTHYPKHMAKIDGMAEGAGLNRSVLYLFHALEAMSAATRYTKPPTIACTAAGIWDRRANTVMLAHNFDSAEEVMPLLVVRKSRGDGELRYMEFSAAPLAGAIDGINEAGLAITYNYAFLNEIGTLGPPTSLAVSEMLARCHSVPEAVQFLKHAPQCGGAILLLVDAACRCAAVELTGRSAAVRRGRRRSGYLFRSNAFRTRSAKKAQIPGDAVFGGLCPVPLRGRRVFESPESRDARMAEVLRDNPPVNPAQLAKLMGDHGNAAEGSCNTICMHSDYWTTLASLQFLPKQRLMRIAYGPACQAQFVDFCL